MIGLATSFFNNKNRALSKDLVDILTESHQELPSWLPDVAYKMSTETSLGGGGANKKQPIRR